MQLLRRTALIILVLAAVWVSLVVSPGISGAAPSRAAAEPYVPSGPPPSNLHDPNTGEPDSGNRSHKAKVSILPAERASRGLNATPRVLDAIRWSTVVWTKRMLGIGD
jgi:hypothetical protein